MGDVVTTKFTGWDELQKKLTESFPRTRSWHSALPCPQEPVTSNAPHRNPHQLRTKVRRLASYARTSRSRLS